MTDADGDGIYQCEAPAGYGTVIFCRMNGSTTENNWDNKWNQTGNLSVPADGKTLCTIPDNQWDCGTSVTWSAMTVSYSLRTTRSITRAMSGASEEQTVVLPEIYISGDKDEAMNLSSINAQMSSDVVYGELEIFVEPEEEVEVIIETVAGVLSDDIRLNFYATVPENAENVYMTFTFNGKLVKVYANDEKVNGMLCFTFPGINPQTMGDAINATLYATVDGVQYIDSMTDYSFVKYCGEVLAFTTDAALVNLISDLLVYGAKAQIYQNYKTDELVTDGFELTPSTFPGVDASFDKFDIQGQPSDRVGYVAQSLKLSSKMTLCLYVQADDPSAYTYHVRVAGVEKTYTAEDLVYVGNDVYCLFFDELKATCFNETITASVECDGETIGGVLSYSVNTYILETYDTSEGVMRELLEAIYNYGNSARNFANKQG